MHDCTEADAVRKGLHSSFNGARSKLSALRKQEDKIWRSTTLSKKEKKERLDRIDEKIMRLIIPLLVKYRALEKMYE